MERGELRFGLCRYSQMTSEVMERCDYGLK